MTRFNTIFYRLTGSVESFKSIWIDVYGILIWIMMIIMLLFMRISKNNFGMEHIFIYVIIHQWPRLVISLEHETLCFHNTRIYHKEPYWRFFHQPLLQNPSRIVWQSFPSCNLQKCGVSSIANLRFAALLKMFRTTFSFSLFSCVSQKLQKPSSLLAIITK